jgi:metal-responsive CopG/Arc/MetJ family transcriptional regulator
MKVKTSLTLSEDILKQVDCRAGGNRSEWIERVVRQHLRKLERDERDRRDVEIYNAIADRLNKESEARLQDQVPWWEVGDEFSDEDFVLGPR